MTRKYDGLLKFDIEENVWRASAVLDLTGRLRGSMNLTTEKVLKKMIDLLNIW